MLQDYQVVVCALLGLRVVQGMCGSGQFHAVLCMRLFSYDAAAVSCETVGSVHIGGQYSHTHVPAVCTAH